VQENWKNSYWKGFKGSKWQDSINVRNFIINNFESYLGDGSFLKGATARTKKVNEYVQKLLIEEREKGGVLDVDVENVSSLRAYAPGYVIKDLDIIVGLQTEKPLCRAVNPFGGLRMSVAACEAYNYKISQKVLDSFKFRTTHNDGVFRVYSEEMRKLRKLGIITGLPDTYSRGRIIGDYRRVPLYGMDFLIKEKEKDKKLLQKRAMSDDNIRLIEEVAKQIEFMQDLCQMADDYGFDIRKPAETAKEAVQWLYFAYLGAVKEQNGAANSIGRITTFLDIYFERDLKKKLITETDAQEIIDDFVIKLRLVRHLRTCEYNDLFAGDPTWVTMAEAGFSEDGRALVTKNSFRILQSLYNLGASCEPNMTILWCEKLPENYKKFCVQTTLDTNALQYENDNVIRPHFADDYSIACCVSALKTGKEMQYFGARGNLPKILLLALNGGRDEITGEKIAKSGPVYPNKVLDFQEVWQLYLEYQEYFCETYVNTINVIHYMHDKYAYERLQMALHDTEVERLVGFGIAGLSVLADSLSAIKHAKVTPIYDERGLIVDFKTIGNFPCFGNDDDRVDDIAKDIVKSFYDSLKEFPTYRNARHTVSVLTITSNVVYGQKTGATPDGRKKGEYFAPGANPMHNRDLEGALASLNSVAKLNYDYLQDGISNTFSVIPETLGKNASNQNSNLIDILDGYFAQGAQHLNVNVIHREKLMEAMANPHLYPNLTVRVSGYAVNFNSLSEEHKKEVIKRTFHERL